MHWKEALSKISIFNGWKSTKGKPHKISQKSGDEKSFCRSPFQNGLNHLSTHLDPINH